LPVQVRQFRVPKSTAGFVSFEVRGISSYEKPQTSEPRGLR
jgi:hypothetical protein